MTRGYVYIVSNPSIPGLLKIGHTMDVPDLRIRQLSTTGVPLPFVLEACFLVADPQGLERAVHAELAEYRPAQNREFFKLSLVQVLEAAMPLVVMAAGTPNDPARKTARKDHGLHENEVQILQLIVSGGSIGKSEFRLEQGAGLNRLDVSVHLANLFSKKLVTRNRDEYWRSTPKGTKLLADSGLIEDWMREGVW